MSEQSNESVQEWREQIGVSAMCAMTCTHDGEDFGPGAVCVTCFANTQRVCNAVLAVVERAVIAAAPPMNYELLYDGSEDPEASAYVEGFREALQAVESLRLPPAQPADGDAS